MASDDTMEFRWTDHVIDEPRLHPSIRGQVAGFGPADITERYATLTANVVDVFGDCIPKYTTVRIVFWEMNGVGYRPIYIETNLLAKETYTALVTPNALTDIRPFPSQSRPVMYYVFKKARLSVDG